MGTTAFEKKGFMDKVKKAASDAGWWVKTHPEETAYITLATIGGVSLAADAIKKANGAKGGSSDRRVWDPSMGFWWDLKRPMTNNEKKFFNARVAQGYDRGSVLSAMKLLK